MSIFSSFTDQLTSIAQSVPLEVFVFSGAMIEEIIAPIPSPIVMTVAGTIAEAQNRPWTYIFLLALIGAIGKTIGSWILYVISDKVEDVVVGKFGKFFGMSHKEIERIGKYFSGGIKDDLIIFFARAIPIVPTAPVSIVCGVIKVRMKTYLASTFFGTIIRNLCYLYLGYAGLAGYETLVDQLESIEKIMTVTIGIILVGGIAAWWYIKNKDKLVEKLEKATLNKK